MPASMNAETQHTAVARTAFVTGISGQDGYYLARLLLKKGYHVHGLLRPKSANRKGLSLLEAERPQLTGQLALHEADITDTHRLTDIIRRTEPDEIYHLAAQSHVRESFNRPEETQRIISQGTINVLEAARMLHDGRRVRVFQASSSEMFGGIPGTSPQSETTPFSPQSPYAAAKVDAYLRAVEYREQHGLFCANGIMFNHESPLRGEDYVTRKLTLAAARIKAGRAQKVCLGNLGARRDWGFAGDYVDAMWRMLQHDTPDDFVIATGESHTIREFAERAFARLGLTYRDHIEIDPQFFRPTEVETVCGDPSKARHQLGWVATTKFAELVELMVDYDYAHTISR